MPDKRGERIGRAACIDPADWEYDGGLYRDFYIKSGLAAVAEARRIDTCNTCNWQTWDENVGWICASHRIRCEQIGFEGCNRHEPKGE